MLCSCLRVRSGGGSKEDLVKLLVSTPGSAIELL